MLSIVPGTSDTWTWALPSQKLHDWVMRGKLLLNGEQMYDVYLNSYLIIKTLNIGTIKNSVFIW